VQQLHSIVVSRLRIVVVELEPVLLEKEGAFSFEKTFHVIINKAGGRSPRVDVIINKMNYDEFGLP
jgi:hypothetical protein